MPRGFQQEKWSHLPRVLRGLTAAPETIDDVAVGTIELFGSKRLGELAALTASTAGLGGGVTTTLSLAAVPLDRIRYQLALSAIHDDAANSLLITIGFQITTAGISLIHGLNVFNVRTTQPVGIQRPVYLPPGSFPQATIFGLAAVNFLTIYSSHVDLPIGETVRTA